jgi:hypothetical protein
MNARLGIQSPWDSACTRYSLVSLLSRWRFR